MIFHIILEWLPCSTWDFVPLHHSHIQGPREGPEQSPSSGHAPGPPIKSHQYIYQWGQGSSSMIQKTRQGPKNNTEHHLNIIWFSIFWQFISYWAINLLHEKINCNLKIENLHEDTQKTN